MRLHYEDALTRLYCGDCFALLKDLEDESIGAIATDPPYSSGARNAASLRGRGSMRRSTGKHGPESISQDNLTGHGFSFLVRLLAAELYRVSITGSHLLCFIDWRQWPILSGAFESAGWTLRACLVWDKGSFGMGNGFRQQAEFCLHASKGLAYNFVRHDTGTVFRHRRPGEDLHPTQKPEGLLVRALSCFPDLGPVLDPFAGSGTSLAAAKRLGRESIGIDIDRRTCEIAAERLFQQVLPLEGAV